MYLDSRDGGCWYCSTDYRKNTEDWAFSIEFDTYVHLSCLRKEIEKDPNDKEAQIMAEELLPEYQLTCKKCKVNNLLLCAPYEEGGERICRWPIEELEELQGDINYILSIRKYGGRKI